MALYNVESPGGYQLTGLTIPGVDILGSKPSYSLDRPWLFEDFDQLTFHEVDEEEYERQRKLFESGRYEYEWEAVEFDMETHNRLLDETKEEVQAVKKRQREAQGAMVRFPIAILLYTNPFSNRPRPFLSGKEQWEGKSADDKCGSSRERKTSWPNGPRKKHRAKSPSTRSKNS